LEQRTVALFGGAREGESRYSASLRGTAKEGLMEVLYSRCCGLDVHKASVSACVLVREETRTHKKYGRFAAMTAGLNELAHWLHELGVTHVAMESTGVYWKPVWNVLEGQFHLLSVNAQHVKNVPGRKTDVKGSEWIAELLQHGLLRPSFVPETHAGLVSITHSITSFPAAFLTPIEILSLWTSMPIYLVLVIEVAPCRD
jgi:hypothetical protein